MNKYFYKIKILGSARSFIFWLINSIVFSLLIAFWMKLPVRETGKYFSPLLIWNILNSFNHLYFS